MGTVSSSGYQQGESGDPSTSSTPAITFLVQEVRQGHSLAKGKAGLPVSGRGWQGCHAYAKLGGWRAKLSHDDEEQVCASAEGSREEEVRVGCLQPGTLLPSDHTLGSSNPCRTTDRPYPAHPRDAVTPFSAAGSDFRWPCGSGS